jgi:hypothetical protein
MSFGGCSPPTGSGGGSGGEEAGGFPPSPPVPGAGTVSAVVRNFTDQYADVSLRFSLFEIMVRQTFVRVPANTSTTVVGPEVTDLLEVSAVAEDGTELREASFNYAEDFEDDTEVIYLIGTEDMPASMPPTLVFLEPLDATEVAPGGELSVTIIDEDQDSSATISFYLEPFEGNLQVGSNGADGEAAPVDAADVATNGPADADGDQSADGAQEQADAELVAFSFALDGDEVVLGTDFAEDPDGQDDQFAFTLPDDLPLGSYRLVAVIADELSISVVQAKGLVQVVADSGESGNGAPAEEETENVAPTLELLEPATDDTVGSGSSFAVAWTDEDPDDNALISLHLDPDDDPLNGNELTLIAGLEEDPDGAADSTELTVADVPPGTYQVVGVIDDGTISAVATAPGRVTVPAP